MSKPTIVRLFVASLIAAAAALVLLVVAGGLAVANGTLIMDGPDVVGFRSGPFGWVMLTLAGVAVLVLVGAAIAQFVAWLGAVLNTAKLEDKTWFAVLLVTGLLSFGFIAMIVYVIAGPDGNEPAPTAHPRAGTPSAVA